MEDLSRHPQGFRKAGSAYRHDHELLEVYRVIRMLAAIQDVHHRNRQLLGIDSPDIPVKRHPKRLCCGFGNRQGYA